MSNIRQRTAPIREKRAGLIAAYAGPIEGLHREAADGTLAPRIRTHTQDTDSDLQAALAVLRSIHGLAIVVHGPAGCASGLHADGPQVPWLVTGLNQRDSIMGGDGKLRAAIRQIHAAFHPEAIAVVTTPVVAINNDDVEAVATELREELGVAITPVFSDGFRSKLAATGHDVVVHALLKNLLPQRPRTPRSHVNLLSLVEGHEEIDALRRLLDDIGVIGLPFPRNGRVADIARLLDSHLSLSIDPDESEYAGAALQQLRGVPYLDPPPPIGIAGTSRWLAAIGTATGHEAQAERVIQQAIDHLLPIVERVRRHAGARIHVHLPPAPAFALIDLLREFELAPSSVTFTAIGTRHASSLQDLAERHPALPVLVGNQPFEEANLLRTVKPDLYLGRGDAAVHALRLGIPVLDLQQVPLYGFAGVERLADGIVRRLGNPAFARFVAEGGDGAYAPGWLGKSTHWYIKHEVK